MIVLLSDFGESEYVGVMKGVIYGVAPEARIIDLCHTIKAHSIIEGAWVLKNSYGYFPTKTVFCCVVDPGVGTKRKAIAVKTESYYFVGPDNGLLWEALKKEVVIEIRGIPVPVDASRTFHGRDVFARATAEIETDEFERTGKRTEEIEKLEFYRKDREGIVVRVDSFGNIVTNLESLGKGKCRVKSGGKEYEMRYFSNYEAAEEGEVFLIEGSSSSLEVSLKRGSANNKLAVKSGDKIKIF